MVCGEKRALALLQPECVPPRHFTGKKSTLAPKCYRNVAQLSGKTGFSVYKFILIES